MSQNSEDPAAKSHYPEVYDHEKDEWFLCPWMGVVANIKTLEKDGTYNWDRPEPATIPTSRPASKSHYSKVTDHGKDQLFVFPWVGIVANIKTIKKDGKYVGESGSKLRDKFRNKGFDVLKVQHLWNYEGHSGYAVVEFDKDWAGFRDAIIF
ncbi:hypothetical protein LWI29_033499 [Acer saccharum]|uniref:XS domain-containing protein n=1 Tax=Acer saccharum TaxID=4024 RepID=A0AA39W849_ACESA|nr:hypothetical protein LWI29_033499 [Acer saccharum]